jgi:hypothetical protein
MREAGGELYLQCQELRGSGMGTTAMDIAEGIWKDMLRAAPLPAATATSEREQRAVALLREAVEYLMALDKDHESNMLAERIDAFLVDPHA